MSTITTLTSVRTNVLTRDFNGHAFVFREDGWFNMTKAAKHFGKQLQNFWENVSTHDYLVALLCQRNHWNPNEYGAVRSERIQTARTEMTWAKRGNSSDSGTWAHPKLAVFFARWLDVKFAVWCDAMIDDILKGKAIARPGGLREVVITKPQESAVAALPEEFTVTAKALAAQVANLQTELSSVYALVREQNETLKELKAAYVRVAFAGTWGGRTWNHQGAHALMSPPWRWCSSA